MEKKELQRLDLSKSEWVINGNNYYLEPNISAGRYKQYEKFSVEFGYGVDFESMHEQIGKAINMINDNHAVQGHTVLYNLYSSMKNNLEKRANRAMKVCSIFILKEGEDPAKYDNKLAEAKIKDWEDGGVAIDDFFHLAFNLVPGLLDALEADSQRDLKKVSKKKS